MRKNLLLLYISVFLTIVGFGMVFPLLPYYAEEFGATAAGIGLLAAAFPLGQIFVSPIVGKISDRIGRRPILIGSIVGSTFSFLLFGAATSFAMLVAARALQGAFTSGSFPIASAYIADSTNKGDRAKYMGRLTAMFSLGIIFGPGIAGLLSAFGSSVPFFAAAGVGMGASLFVYFLLPESLSKKRKSKEKVALVDTLAVFGRIWRGMNGGLNVLFFAVFARAFAISNFQVAFPLFIQDLFRIDATGIGIIFSFIGVMSALAQFILMPYLINRWGEYRTALLSALIMGVGQILIPYSEVVALLVFITGISVIGGSMLRPTIYTILSKETKEGQGATMGIAFSFTSLGRIIGPVIAGALIAYVSLTTQFIVTGLILFSAALFIKKRYKIFGVREYFQKARM